MCHDERNNIVVSALNGQRLAESNGVELSVLDVRRLYSLCAYGLTVLVYLKRKGLTKLLNINVNLVELHAAMLNEVVASPLGSNPEDAAVGKSDARAACAVVVTQSGLILTCKSGLGPCQRHILVFRHTGAESCRCEVRSSHGHLVDNRVRMVGLYVIIDSRNSVFIFATYNVFVNISSFCQWFLVKAHAIAIYIVSRRSSLCLAALPCQIDVNAVLA